MPEPVRGPGAVLTMPRESAGFFPTSRIGGVHSFGQAHWVCIENVESGARKDSHKSYRIRTCYTFRVADGRLSEIRFYYDALGMVTQIGMSLSGD